MMKRILIILLACASTHAAHVEFNLADFALAGTLTNRTLNLTPLSTPRVSGTNIITSDRRTYTTGTNQSVTVSNVVFGNYDVEIRGPFKSTLFTILVPDTNITVSATGLITSTITVPNSTVGYSQSAADARFIAKTNDWSTGQTLTNASVNGFTILGTTNQVVFGATNNPPSSTVAPTKWISVKVTGESTVYRLPLYQ